AVGAGWLATVPAAAAPGAGSGAVLTAAASQPGVRAHPWIAITSLSPTIAKPKGQVIVSGIVANPTSAPLQGPTVQLWSSGFALSSRSAMNGYLNAQSSSGLDAQVPVARLTLPGRVPPHGTQQWTLTLKVSQAGMRTFGVYPLAAQLSSAAAELDVARTFLPFWPGKHAARTVKPLTIGWVWPLIDTPQRGACPALLSNELAASVAPDGRLYTLLEAGQGAGGRRAALTWAIDPALLSDVSVMQQPYRVSAHGDCTGGKTEQASRPAAAWLSDVKDLASEQDFFVTPYADVDMAAMAHHGLDSELTAAFADGQLVAQKLLGRSQRSTPATHDVMAWPPGGVADYGVLEELAAQQHVQVMIMDSKLMPPVTQVSYTPTAATTTPTGFGGLMHVLLSDHEITQILSLRRSEIPGVVPGPAAMPARVHTQIRQAAAFAKEQWFLAETAMIAAEQASTSRALVAAPPRRWDPSLSLAEALLNETATAPWLRPATLASIVTDGPAPGSPIRRAPPSRPVSRGELTGSLLRQLRDELVAHIHLLDSILTTGGQGYLSTAVDAVESSAWRGGRRAQRPAAQLLRRELSFVQGKLAQVRITVSSRVTLGGKAGDVPVSVRNDLSQPVTVQVKARVSAEDQVTIAPYKRLVKVPAKSQIIVRIPVRAAAAGSKTLTLWLATPEGAALPGHPASLTVTATHFGTLAIVIISVALVVFVLSAAARAIRRGGPQDGSAGAEAEELDPMPSPGDPASGGDEPGSVGSGTADERQPAKEDDEHATAPGGADRR
ncbi:MAG TPA: DUF6049 family protein, partial [Streptosporangiaceae bacterium]|nr:DUF6049 family protein [Streptosporangiaceae bacterium]